MSQIDSVIVVSLPGAPMDLADSLTLIGLVATAIGLMIAAWQIRQSRLTSKATFMLELYRSMDQHNELHRKFRFGGWAQGDGPSTSQEWMQVGRLLGLFEYIAILVSQRVLTLADVDRLYAYRLVYPFTNKIVASRYFGPGGGWQGVIDLEQKLQKMPLYSDLKTVALSRHVPAHTGAHPTLREAEAVMATTQTSSWAPDTVLMTITETGERLGIRRVHDALRECGVPAGIAVSTDPEVRAATGRLQTPRVPNGFSQHQLPIVLAGSDTMHFITRGDAHAQFPEHIHKDDDGLRLVVEGSIVFRGSVLMPGDWFYVPRGEAYSFAAGDQGCLLYHVYKPAGDGRPNAAASSRLDAAVAE